MGEGGMESGRRGKNEKLDLNIVVSVLIIMHSKNDLITCHS